MWGPRAVIPHKYRQKVLDELHGGHMGVVKMKALARAHVWWPNIDRDIEGASQSCTGCQLMKHPCTPVGVSGGALAKIAHRLCWTV